MICRSCLLLRAPAARTAPSCAPTAAAAAVARLSLLPRRGFALTRAVRADPPPSATDAAAAGAAPTTATPPLTNPLSTGGGAASSSGAAADAASILRTPAPPKSSCLPGTPLEGLNFLKDRQDPVALPDDEYPDWLWTILEREEKEVGTGDAGEFCVFFPLPSLALSSSVPQPSSPVSKVSWRSGLLLPLHSSC
jgi:large subunit ribosomal protein L54